MFKVAVSDREETQKYGTQLYMYMCVGVRHLISWFHLAVVFSQYSGLTPPLTSCL